MKVVRYNFESNLHDAFIQMNLKWINEMFKVEQEDERVLTSIDDGVRNGNIIYFSLSDDNEPLSCLMLVKIDNDNYELCKFASNFKQKGSGNLLINYVLEDAKGFCKRIFIATNTKCIAAIHLYEKYGFTVYNSKNTYGFSSDRVNICYEKIL